MGEARYFAPTVMEEAVHLLAEYGGRVTVLAGGTDLVPRINVYDLKPDILMYIGDLGLGYIKEEDGAVVIGSTTTTAAIASSEIVAARGRRSGECGRIVGDGSREKRGDNRRKSCKRFTGRRYGPSPHGNGCRGNRTEFHGRTGCFPAWFFYRSG